MTRFLQVRRMTLISRGCRTRLPPTLVRRMKPVLLNLAVVVTAIATALNIAQALYSSDSLGWWMAASWSGSATVVAAVISAKSAARITA